MAVADTTWYRQQIPREYHRRDALSAAKVTAFFVSFFVLAYIVLGLFFGSFVGPTSFWLLVVVLPLVAVATGILMYYGTRQRDVSEVGVSDSGVTLRFADGGTLDVPWSSVDDVECFSREDFYGIFAPCSLYYRDRREKSASALLLKESAVVIQKRLWRRDFRERRKPPAPVSRPGFSDDDYAAPRWLKDGLEAVYQESYGDRPWIRVLRKGGEPVVQTRTELGGRSREFAAELYEDPDERKIWMEVEEEWVETPLRAWQRAMYGTFLINVRRDPKAQWVQGNPAEFLGAVDAVLRGRKCRSLSFLTRLAEDCVCETYRRLHKRITSKELRPGTCMECRGEALRRKSCTACGGTGRHEACHGTGVVHAEVRYWFEAGTGILLRWERDEGGVKDTSELERLEPDVLLLPDRGDD